MEADDKIRIGDLGKQYIPVWCRAVTLDKYLADIGDTIAAVCTADLAAVDAVVDIGGAVLEEPFGDGLDVKVGGHLADAVDCKPQSALLGGIEAALGLDLKLEQLVLGRGAMHSRKALVELRDHRRSGDSPVIVPPAGEGRAEFVRRRTFGGQLRRVDPRQHRPATLRFPRENRRIPLLLPTENRTLSPRRLREETHRHNQE